MLYTYLYQFIAFTVEGARDTILRLFTSQFTYVLETRCAREKKGENPRKRVYVMLDGLSFLATNITCIIQKVLLSISIT